MTIRKAEISDAHSLANCLLLALEDIVYEFIGEKNSKTAREFLLYFIERDNNQYSYQNCWVAEMGNEIVAAVNLYPGSELDALRKPVLDYLKNELGREITPEDETQTGEIYIDSLGVNPSFQGQGIGAQMLKFLIDLYVLKQHETLGLLVDENNLNAKKLYLKMGFKPDGKITLLGKHMEHLQIGQRL